MAYSQINNSILETIGSTPLIKLNKVVPADLTQHQFLAKIEYFNPAGSIKDRIALAMVEAAEERGELKAGGTIVEATAGNTGLGLALVAAIKGYKCIFVLPAKMSGEKRALLRSYGARVVITPNGVDPESSMSHYSVAKQIATAIKNKTGNCFYANQYHNLDNMDYHYKVTGPEIWNQTEGNIDVFVAGVGTGGTLSGVAKFLKEQNKDIKILCTDPIGSILYDLYYHGKVIDPPKPYLVEGVGEDMLPDNCQLKLFDDFVKVTDQEAFQLTRRLALEEGLCVGPSSGLILAGALKHAKTLKKPSRILVIMPDTGKSYLSKVFNDQWMVDNKLDTMENIKSAFNIEIPAEKELQQYKE